jgi:hypothetical protein
MKRILLSFCLISVLNILNAQCDNKASEASPGDNDATPSTVSGAIGATPYSTSANLSTSSFPGGYINVDDVLPSQTYTVSADVATTFFTVRQGTVVLASGNSPLSFTPTTKNRIVINMNSNSSCGTGFSTLKIYLSGPGSGVGTTAPSNKVCGSAVGIPTNSIRAYSTANPSVPSFFFDNKGYTVSNYNTSPYCTGTGSVSGGEEDVVWYSFTASNSTMYLRHGSIAPTYSNSAGVSPTTFLGAALYSTCPSPTATPATPNKLACGLTSLSTNEFILSGLSSGSTYYLMMYGNNVLGNAYAPMYLMDKSITVPVELVKFEAIKKGNTNILSWQTASEKNNSHFDIERSTTGQDNWVKIGSVKGNGSSQIVRDYSFTDNGPLSISYYRLKQNDNNGSFEYSNVVNVANKSTKFKINALMPNPTKDNLTIQFESNNGEAVQIAVMDMTGRVVLTQNAKNTEGPNAVVLNMANLSNGIYMVSLKNSENVILNKIVKN